MEIPFTQKEFECMDGIANIFKLDRVFVIDKMDEATNQGKFTIEMLGKSLMEVEKIVETKEQFIAICSYLAYSTRMGLNINYAINNFLKVYCGKIDVKKTIKNLVKIIENHNGGKNG